MLGFSITKINGNSMEPRLYNGSFGYFSKWCFGDFTKGKVCKIQHPRYGLIVKQLAFIDRNGFCWFCGKNRCGSLSMIDIGPISKHQIRGYLVASVSPPIIGRYVTNK